METELTRKRFLANFALLLAVVEMSSNVFGVSLLWAQLDVTQFTLKQFVVHLVNVVLVLREAVFIRRHKVTLVTSVRLRSGMTWSKHISSVHSLPHHIRDVHESKKFGPANKLFQSFLRPGPPNTLALPNLTLTKKQKYTASSSTHVCI